METNEAKVTGSPSYQTYYPITRTILNQVARSKRIPVAKLVAKNRISTKRLYAVLRNLSDEGLVRIQPDKFGFDWVEWIGKRTDTPGSNLIRWISNIIAHRQGKK
jgi:predicted methyltransferase